MWRCVIKDYGASSGDETIRRKLAQRKDGASIEYVSAFSDKHELIRLYKSCDAFISAHRGEGFGLKILDGMACGLPVITPLFGGPTAYCRQDNCFPVDFSLVPMRDSLDTRSLHVTNQPMWAEVDRQSLAAEMRSSLRRPDRRQDCGCPGPGRGARALLLGQRSRQVDRNHHEPSRASDDGSRGRRTLRHHRSPVHRTGSACESASSCQHTTGRRSCSRVWMRSRAVDPAAGIRSRGRRRRVDRRDDGKPCRGSDFAFALRYYRQDGAGPGAARNLASSRPAASSCSSSATTSSPTSVYSRSICWRTPPTPSRARRSSGTSTGRRA